MKIFLPVLLAALLGVEQGEVPSGTPELCPAVPCSTPQGSFQAAPSRGLTQPGHTVSLCVWVPLELLDGQGRVSLSSFCLHPKGCYTVISQ